MSCSSLGVAPMLLLTLVAVNVNATDWPESAAEYDPQAVVTVDTEALARLDDAELRALLDFAGSCGRVLLIGVNSPVEQVFRNGAACGGRYLAVAADSADAAAMQARLAGLPPPPRASDTQLRNLLEASAGDSLRLPVLGLFLAGYVLVFAVLLLSARTRPVALGFCLLATLLVPVLWPAPTSSTFVAWAEAAADESVAGYRGLQRVSRFEAGRYAAEQTWSRGGFAARPALGVSGGEHGVSVCNRGAAPSAASHLYWRGELYALPRLEPGATWSTAGAQALPPEARSAPELLLFRERAWRFYAAWLRPLPTGDRPGLGWLMRYAMPAPGENPCAD